MMRILAERSGQSVHIANVASGPITDLVELFEQLPEIDLERLTVTCIDQDPIAIEYAQNKIRAL
jgi:hypothetical protein